MTFLVISFLAGVLTVLAPCILPLLPVVIGSSASGRSKWTPYIVVGSLALSIILFTYLLKASTAFIMIPQATWSYLSGGILTLFGITLLFPSVWEKVPGLSRISAGSNQLVGQGYQKKSAWGDVLIGAALGPVFSTCSPTYFVILASVLPVSFALGTTYLLAYVLGLSIVLLLIGLLGERFTSRLSGLADSRGFVKRAVGILFIVLGLAIMTGYEKKLETAILSSGYFDITKVEQRLLQNADPTTDDSSDSKEGSEKQTSRTPYVEIVDPAGFVNTDPLKLGDLVGKKVILLDFMTYSCINCQRTFPFLNAWYEKYKDAGLEIVGIHTPEFAFEHDIDNVRSAARQFGLEFPIVLDNDYATWRAYGNSFWPHKYLIDIQGNIVYDHIGEGAYDETEMKIRELLMDRAVRLGESAPLDMSIAAHTINVQASRAESPETYFGARRNKTLTNGTSGVEGTVELALPDSLDQDKLYLKGTWNITREFAEAGASSEVVYRYQAQDVYLVARSSMGARVEILVDGTLVGSARGDDVAKDGTASIVDSRLYKLIHHPRSEEHTLTIRVLEGSVEFYTFTFG